MIRPPHSERHFVDRIGWLRAAVLGANDGIVSTASLIVGVAAAAATRNDILIAAVAGLVAGAMSMAAGEYVSVSSQSDTEIAELARERKELVENVEFELDELTMIYIRRGVEPALARKVAQQLMAQDALTAHARDELGISEITTARPVQDVLGWCGYAVAHGCRVASGHAHSGCVHRILGLPRPARRARGESRRCEYHARHHPGGVLGSIGPGHDGRHRQTRRCSRMTAASVA